MTKMAYESRLEVIAHHLTGHYGNQCCFRGGWIDKKAGEGCDCIDDAADLLKAINKYEESIMESQSDERTQNNSVRHNYRVLTDDEKAQMVAFKDAGAAFIAMLHEIGGTKGDNFASRDLSLANTHMEDAVMRAVRHITK